MLWRGNDLTLKSYQENTDGFNLDRQLSRIQFSFATTKGTNDDDKSSRLAFGFTLTPWDRGDPRNDQNLLGCISGYKEINIQNFSPGEIANLSPEDLEKVDKARKLKNAIDEETLRLQIKLEGLARQDENLTTEQVEEMIEKSDATSKVTFLNHFFNLFSGKIPVNLPQHF